jgi:hypothetical protein
MWTSAQMAEQTGTSRYVGGMFDPRGVGRFKPWRWRGDCRPLRSASVQPGKLIVYEVGNTTTYLRRDAVNRL